MFDVAILTVVCIYIEVSFGCAFFPHSLEFEKNTKIFLLALISLELCNPIPKKPSRIVVSPFVVLLLNTAV